MIYYLRDSNSGLIGLEYNGTTYYYEKNAQDDVTKILDGEFNVVAKYEYDAWGNVISIKDSNGNNITDEAHIGNINPFRYRSYYYDQEIGMYYLNSRYYNPLWGRFINADGILNGNKDIKGCNLYSYVGNNPVNNTDSEGKFLKKIGKMIANGAKKIVKTVKKVYSTVKTTINKLVDISNSTTKKIKDNGMHYMGITYSNTSSIKTSQNSSKILTIGCDTNYDNMLDNSINVQVGNNSAVNASFSFSESSIGVENSAGTSLDVGISLENMSIFMSVSKSKEIDGDVSFVHSARVDVSLAYLVALPAVNFIKGIINFSDVPSVVNNLFPTFE